MRRHTQRDSQAAPEDLLIRQAQEGNPVALNTLGLLPSSERELILLEYCGLAVPEILDSSDQNIEVQLSRARDQMQQVMAVVLNQEQVTRSAQCTKHEPPKFASRDHEALLQRYHELVDTDLAGALSQKDERELQEIEGKLQAIEDAETSQTERVLEERHRMLMQQLRDLTTELRKFGGQQKSKVQ